MRKQLVGHEVGDRDAGFEGREFRYDLMQIVAEIVHVAIGAVEVAGLLNLEHHLQRSAFP